MTAGLASILALTALMISPWWANAWACTSIHYFICGPEAMTQAVERALHGLGVPLRQMHTDLFDMA